MHVRRYTHTHTHTHTQSRARYSQALSRGFGISDTSTVASTPEVWILAFKDCFPLKKPGLLGEMADSRAPAARLLDELSILCCISN